MRQDGTGVGAHQAISIGAERARLNQSIAEDQQRLDAAKHTVAEFDRPLVRRRHRLELEGAHRQLDWVPRSLEQTRGKLAGLDGTARRAGERVQAAEALDRDLPQLKAECAVVRDELNRDARGRSQDMGIGDVLLVDKHLGPKPPGAAAADLWSDAAGHLLQHHAAFDLPEDTVLGPKPDFFGEEAFATSRQATSKAIDRLDRALGRVPEIEPPHMSLDLGW